MKYHIEKNTVQETLVIPLFGRLVCSEHFPELFSDPEAKRICDGPVRMKIARSLLERKTDAP